MMINKTVSSTLSLSHFDARRCNVLPDQVPARLIISEVAGLCCLFVR